mgnify:FL=1
MTPRQASGASMTLKLRNLLPALFLPVSGSLFAAIPPVTLPDGKVVQLSGQAVAALQRQSVSATSPDKTASYGGHDLREIPKAAGVPTEALRGKDLTSTVVDGYQSAFTLPELDPMIGNKQVLMIDQDNGQPLQAADGSWRLVVPTDHRPTRWVRQLASIAVSAPRLGDKNFPGMP